MDTTTESTTLVRFDEGLELIPAGPNRVRLERLREGFRLGGVSERELMGDLHSEVYRETELRRDREGGVRESDASNLDSANLDSCSGRDREEEELEEEAQDVRARGEGVQIRRPQLRYFPVDRRVMLRLLDGDGPGTAVVAASIDVGYKTAQRSLRKLEAKGLVGRTGRARATRWWAREWVR